MLVTLDGIVMEINWVLPPPILNIFPPMTINPLVNSTWEREEQ